jgi:hypothetical protein
LSKRLSRQLAEDSAASRGREPAFEHIAEEDFPGAVRPTGTYIVDGSNVWVRLRVKRDGKDVARVETEGQQNDLPKLVSYSGP